MSSPSQLSFLPDDYLERKAQRRTNLICAFLFVAVMAGVGSAFAISEKSMKRLQAQHQQVDKTYTEAARRIEQVKQMQEKQRKMARQAELSASLLERVPRSFLLAELTNNMPAGVSLLEFHLTSKPRAEKKDPLAEAKTAFDRRRAALSQQKTPEAAAPEPRKLDVSLKLVGVADTDVQVAAYMNRLNRSSLLKDVNLVVSDEFDHGGRKLRKFQFEMAVHPDAEVKPVDLEKVRTTAVELDEKR